MERMSKCQDNDLFRRLLFFTKSAAMMNVRCLQRSAPRLVPFWSMKGPQRLARCATSYMGRRSSSFIATSSWRNHCEETRPTDRTLSLSVRYPNLVVSLLRRPFSSQTDKPRRYSNDGLVNILVEPHFESIRQLPEVDNALRQWDDTEAVEEFQRAIQVFEMMEKGGALHVAVLALLVECLLCQGSYEEAVRVLQTLEELVPPANNEARLLIDLASAKALCYEGDFNKAMEKVEKMQANEASDSSSLTKGCVLNAEAIVGFTRAINGKEGDYESAVDELDHISDLIDTKDALVSACVKGTVGVAKVILNFVSLDEESKSETGVLDEAMDVFREALDVLDRIDSSTPSSDAATADLIRAHLYCNMAWTALLQEDQVKLASDYSSSALSFAEKLQNRVSDLEYHHALGRSLDLVACCYARVDSALTAEGLFQSAIDSLEKASKDPLAKLSLRDAHNDYASLLRQWDKRSRDAEIQEEKGQVVNDTLPQAWKDKPSILSGLMFITP